MSLEPLISPEMPPFAAHTLHSLHTSLAALFVTKAMKTSSRILHSRVKLYARQLPEVAAGGDCADFTGEQSPGDDQLVSVPVLCPVCFVKNSSFLSETSLHPNIP